MSRWVCLSAHFCPAPSPPVKRLLLLLPKKLNAHSGVGTRDPDRPTKPPSRTPPSHFAFPANAIVSVHSLAT